MRVELHIGRKEVTLTDERAIGLYSAERWLRRRSSQPAKLLAMARSFPKAEPALRGALEILL